MKEFLNPKSMLTPGVAGGTMMFLVNGLSAPFPELPVRYVALALSFLIGAVVFNAANLKLVERAVYWVLNSLVIFVVGFGAASIGYEASRGPVASGATVPVAERVVPAWLVASAYAAEEPGMTKGGKPSGAAAKKGVEWSRAAAAEAEKLKVELEALRIENERLKKANKAADKPGAQQFFRKW